MAKPIPNGYGTITAHLCIRKAAEAIDFYRKAFGAEVVSRADGPGGMVLHAALKIGDTIFMLVDEMPQMKGWVSPQRLGGTTIALHLSVEDVDSVFDRAVAAGCKVSLPVMNAFWGDRYGKVTDPYGHEWTMATHVEDVPAEEVARRAEAFFKNME